MTTIEDTVVDFYAARGRHDWERVRTLLAPDVIWHESDGNMDYSGAHHGRDTVAGLLAKFIEITAGTFALEPQDLIHTAEHVAVSVRWRAERNGTHVEGNDLAVYRVTDNQIAAAWFFPDGFDPEALGKVFSFATSD